MIQNPKSKVTRKPETSGAVKTAGSKVVAGSKPKVSEEKIRQKAEEIYYQRIEHGVNGTASEDWLKAEKLLKVS